MLARGFTILGQAGGGGAVAAPPPAWPPATGLHLHSGISYTGTPTDVQSIVFPSGLTMSAVGAGDPITIDASGLHFWMGKYLQYIPPANIPYSGMAAFARITNRPIPNSPYPNGNSDSFKLEQQPLGVVSNTARLFSYKYHNRTVTCDMGAAFFSTRDVEGIGTDAVSDTFTIGAYYSVNGDEGEYGGASALWLNGRILEASTASEIITPTEWVVGKDMYGTLHEGVLFTQHQGSTDPLFPPGGSSQWAMGNLAV